MEQFSGFFIVNDILINLEVVMKAFQIIYNKFRARICSRCL